VAVAAKRKLWRAAVTTVAEAAVAGTIAIAAGAVDIIVINMINN
jgi:hypothetical protein